MQTAQLQPKCPPKGARRHIRRRHIINGSFQWRYATAIMVVVFCLTSFLTMVLYDLLHRQARAMIISRGATIGEVRLVMLCSALTFSIVTSAAIGLWSLLFTHRICGPLFVMNRYLNELGDGKLPTIRPLRAKDEFKEIHASLARAVETLRARREAELRSLSSALELARGAPGGAEQKSLQALASSLEAMCNEAAQALASNQHPAQSPAGARESTHPSNTIAVHA